MPQAVQLDKHGEPGEVLQVRDIPKPTPQAGEALIKMKFSPINPSEMLLIRGDYGPWAKYPVTPGYEGVGIVEEVNNPIAKFVMGIKPGQRVIVLNPGPGNWQEYVTVPALRCFPVPANLSDEQAACYFVNPATAWAMTREVLKVPAGAWLIQSAAGSAVGRMVIKLGKKFGFKTINVVRSEATKAELKTLGAEYVLVANESNLLDQLKEITKGEQPTYALDCVGGEMGSAVLSCLGKFGQALIYGTLDKAPTQIKPRHVLMNQQTISGFSLNHWTAKQSKLKMLSLLKTLGPQIADGTLQSEIGPMFPLKDVAAAIQASESQGRKGKVLLQCGTVSR